MLVEPVTFDNAFVHQTRISDPPPPPYVEGAQEEARGTGGAGLRNCGCTCWVPSQRVFWIILANPCKLRIRRTHALCPHQVGSAYGRAIRTISTRLVNHGRIRANPLGLRIHANCESASQLMCPFFPTHQSRRRRCIASAGSVWGARHKYCRCMGRWGWWAAPPRNPHWSSQCR